MVSQSIRIPLFWVINVLLVVSGITIGYFLNNSSELDILPVVMETKNHKAPLRVPGVFREEHSSDASKGELKFNDNKSFTFVYNKSDKQDSPFAGVWFPLENIELDFSEYSDIEVGIVADKARRIPFNLSVQNNLETHQYVRKVIEIEEGIDVYEIPLDEFETPASWYQRNDIRQIDIPKPDLSKVEALSFESCQLLKSSTEDRFTINKLVLKKDLSKEFSSIITIVTALLVLVYYLFKS